MDDVTLIALKESIKKWESRANGEHTLTCGTHNCPLCRLFHSEHINTGANLSCKGCPVFEKTAVSCCRGTPYEDYIVNRTDFHAQQELEFLRSLLPAEEAKEKKKGFGWVDLDYLKG